LRLLLIGSSANSDRMLAFRTIALLTAVVLTVFQPTLAICECAGCDKGCTTHSASASTSRAAATPSCCSPTKSDRKSCCGALAGACPCGNCGDSDAVGSQSAVGGNSCSCSAPSHATAVESRAVQVNNALTIHHWLVADASYASHILASALEAACSAERGSPPRFGNLRVHAYLGVWIV
jgi:hypothetical protein